MAALESAPSPIDLSEKLLAVVLAAGKGTRMRSRQAKVLHPFLGQPMVLRVVDAAFEAGAGHLVAVVGHQGEEVGSVLLGAKHPNLSLAQQREQRGTGHALQCALEGIGSIQELLLLYGDTPLISAACIQSLLNAHRESHAVVTITSFQAENPKGYGRILRDPKAPERVVGIVEEADASESQRLITEVNAGFYVISGDRVREGLASLKPANAQGELYITDIVSYFVEQGDLVACFALPDALEAAGVNTRVQLAELEAQALHRLRKMWMERGVSMLDPTSVRIEAGCTLGEDTILGPNVQILGQSKVGRGCRIDAGVILDNCVLGDEVHVKPYSVLTQAVLEACVEVGPFAHLRSGTILGEGVKVGNFVETKKARFARGAKASHLSYLGDCEIGANVNVGAGTITCNYDGVDKHQTIIEEGAFIGSDTQLVAPVTVGAFATVAAGSTITRDVPPGALALTRSEQRHSDNYYMRRRKPREDAKRAKKET